MWFGLGEADVEGRPVPRSTGALFMLVQTLAATALGAGIAAIWATLFDRTVPVTFPPGYLVLFVPLAIGVARRPQAAVVPAAVGLLTGAVVTVATRAALAGAMTGFWWWFTALAAGAIAAGVVFGALAARKTTD